MTYAHAVALDPNGSPASATNRRGRRQLLKCFFSTMKPLDGTQLLNPLEKATDPRICECSVESVVPRYNSPTRVNRQHDNRVATQVFEVRSLQSSGDPQCRGQGVTGG